MTELQYQQWSAMKAKHPDSIHLYREGDFYTAYERDAEVCAKDLGITLFNTDSDFGAYAQFPRHALDTYLPKLIRCGRRVAIIDWETSANIYDNDNKRTN